MTDTIGDGRRIGRLLRRRRGDTLVMVMAGGEGGRLEPLTAERAKPVTPVAGTLRLIDIPLSHAMHAGLGDVWVVHQYRPHGLAEYLRNGRPWDLDRSRGGLLLLGPSTGDAGAGWHEGNADAIWRHRTAIAEMAPRDVLVVSADHLYRMDWAEVLDDHREGGADLTMVTTEVEGDDPARFGVVQAAGDGRVTGFAYKPERPEGRLVTTEVFAYRAEALLDSLGDLAREAGDEGLSDFGHGLVPRLVAAGAVREHRHRGYWRDVGTIPSYWRAHRDLLRDPDLLHLDDAQAPFVGGDDPRAAVRLARGARVEDALVSPGCRIAGEVVRSVLAPGVVVGEGASVRDAVLLQDVVVAPGASVAGAIVDMRATIGTGARVGAPAGDHASREQLVLVEMEGVVHPGATVPPGTLVGRAPDGDRALAV